MAFPSPLARRFGQQHATRAKQAQEICPPRRRLTMLRPGNSPLHLSCEGTYTYHIFSRHVQSITSPNECQPGVTIRAKLCALACICLNKHFTMKSVWKLRPQRLIIKNILQGTKRKLDYALDYSDFQTIEARERNKDTNIGFKHVSRQTESRHCHSPDTNVNLVAGKEATCMLGGRKEGGCNPATSCRVEVSLPVFQCSMRGPRDTQQRLSWGVSVPLASEMHPVVIN